MLEGKIAVEQAALHVPAKVSINTDDSDTLVYDAQTRLISVKGLLLTIDPGQHHIIQEGDSLTCTLSYKRKVFYSSCIALKVKGDQIVLRYFDTEFERLMVLKYILEDCAGAIKGKE